MRGGGRKRHPERVPDQPRPFGTSTIYDQEESVEGRALGPVGLFCGFDRNRQTFSGSFPGITVAGRWKK